MTITEGGKMPHEQRTTWLGAGALCHLAEELIPSQGDEPRDPGAVFVGRRKLTVEVSGVTEAIKDYA